MPDYVRSSLSPLVLTSHLQALLDQLDASDGDVKEALALPPECYTSQEWFEFERRAIFDRDWVALGHHADIPDPGDYFQIDVLSEPLLVVRGRDGQIRVLSAVCRHRGHVLGEARGNAQGFTCPFHGWSYDLEGTLTGAPEMEGTLPFDELRRQACLPRFRSEIWNGFIFVNLDGQAPPLASRLRGLSKLIENHNLAELGSVPPVEWPNNPWNWKFMQENAMEPYHTHYLHSGIHDFAPSQNTKFKEWDDTDDAAIYREVIFTHPDGGFNLANRALMPPLPDLTDAERHRVVFAALMPNLFLGAQPDAVFYYIVLPESPHAITLRVGLLTSYDNLDLPTAELLLKGTIEGVEVFNDQDTIANTQTHRGLRSRVAPRSRWAPKEKTLAQMNRWLITRYRAYAATLKDSTLAAAE